MEIWIGRDGERHGPYKEDDVRDWLRSGQVKGSDLAWREGLADWQPLSVLFPDVTVDASVPPTGVAPALPQATAAAAEDYAGFWKRFLAYIIDAIILWIPSKLLNDVFGGAAVEAAAKQAAMNAAGDAHAMLAIQMHAMAQMWPATLLGFVVAWWYYALCESSAWQATIGKLALGMRTTDMEGQRLKLGRALIRYPAMILSSLILFIGYIMVAFTRKKQGLHDLIAGTLVLNGRASEFKSTPVKPTSSGGSFSA